MPVCVYGAFFAVWVLLGVVGQLQDSALVKLRPEDCTGDEFFDISHLSCAACGETARPTADRLSCRCRAGMRLVHDLGGATVACEECARGQVPTPDGWDCIACADGRSTADASSCRPCANASDISYVWSAFGVLQREQMCSDCKGDTRPDALARHFCTPCNPAVDGKGCHCARGERSGGVCFETTKAKQALIADNAELSKVPYADGATLDSAYLRQHTRAAVGMCALGNATACQLLGNLCVLLHYSAAATGGNACDEYNRLASDSGQRVQWPNNMPWLFYINSEAPTVLSRTDLPVAYSFDSADVNSRLRLVVAQYALNGTYLGMVNVLGGLLQLCKTQITVMDGAYRFGRKYRQHCALPIRDFWRWPEPIFYDPYVEFSDGDGVTRLYPLPVLNRALLVGGQAVNMAVEREEWRLTRRFFLVDTVSAKEPGAKADAPPKIVRYPKLIRLNVEIRPQKLGRIYPPYLELDYSDALLENLDDNPSVEVQFSVGYSSDTGSFDRYLEYTVVLLCVLAVGWAAVRAWSWTRRTGKYAIDLTTIIKFAIYWTSTLGELLLGCTLVTSAWLLFFYKWQKSVVYVVLTDEQAFFLRVCICVAAAAKLINLLHTIVENATAETFFMDWERPRGHVIPSTVDAPTGDATPPPPRKESSPITIWRTYMVANEWNELQHYRKTSAALQLFAMLFLLEFLNLKAIALVEPGVHLGTTPSEHEYTAMNRFVVAATLYLLVGFAQWTVNVMIIERFVVDHFRNFMDLCSISNMSVLCLTRAQFGFYVHGRSVHGHADTDMAEMNQMLQRERDNLCGQRGLEPGTEEQCFVVALPNAFREKYEAVRAPVRSVNLPALRQTGLDATTARMENVIRVYEQMNRLLEAFIDQRLPDVGYTIQNRKLPEALLDVEFDDTAQQGIFYRDFSDIGYSSAFLYGNEWTHLSSDLMVFCIADLVLSDFLAAAIVTYAVVMVLQKLAEHLYTNNLVKTSLVDDRFLI